jgi:hypothetical protein
VNAAIEIPRLVYLAGPITGMPDANRQAFADAEAELTAHGWRVHSPIGHPLSHEAYLEAEQLGIDYRTGPLYQRLMRDCYETILAADRVYLLDDWEKSHGATTEAFFATRIGTPVYEFRTGELLMRSFLLMTGEDD